MVALGGAVLEAGDITRPGAARRFNAACFNGQLRTVTLLERFAQKHRGTAEQFQAICALKGSRWKLSFAENTEKLKPLKNWAASSVVITSMADVFQFLGAVARIPAGGVRTQALGNALPGM